MNCSSCPNCFTGRCAQVCAPYQRELAEFHRDHVHERFMEAMAPFLEK